MGTQWWWLVVEWPQPSISQNGTTSLTVTSSLISRLTGSSQGKLDLSLLFPDLISRPQPFILPLLSPEKPSALLLAAPNQLDGKCCDPCGDYLNALVAERFALKLGTNMAAIQGKLWLLIAPSTVWKAPVGLGRTPLLVHQIGWVMFLAEPMTVSTCRRRSGQMGTSTSIGPSSSLRWRSSNSWLCCQRRDGTHQKILHTERRYLLRTKPIPWQKYWKIQAEWWKWT